MESAAPASGRCFKHQCFNITSTCICKIKKNVILTLMRDVDDNKNEEAFTELNQFLDDI